MFESKFIFSQIIDFVSWRRFQTRFDRNNGDYKIKSYRCVGQFCAIAFAQLIYHHNLREVEACLRSVQAKHTI